MKPKVSTDKTSQVKNEIINQGEGVLSPTAGGRIIALFGIEASGKSTISDLLYSYLRRKEIPAIKTEIGAKHMLVYVIYRIYKAVRRTSLEDGITMPALPHSRIRLWLEIVGMVPRLCYVRLARFLGFVVITEKYVPFALATFYRVFGKSVLNSFAARVLLRFLDKNTLLVHLECDYCEHRKRRQKNRSRKSWIDAQQEFYSLIRRRFRCVTVDTRGKRVKENFEEVMSIIGGTRR